MENNEDLNEGKLAKTSALLATLAGLGWSGNQILNRSSTVDNTPITNEIPSVDNKNDKDHSSIEDKQSNNRSTEWKDKIKQTPGSRGMPNSLKDQNKKDVVDKIRDFVHHMKYEVNLVNDNILKERKWILHLTKKEAQGRILTPEEIESLNYLYSKYGVKNDDRTELLKRVNIIPINLAIAQAALESGWGTSNLAVNHQAFFGHKSFDTDEKRTKTGRNEHFKSFNSITDSTTAYAKNLNTHPAYAAFRDLRDKKTHGEQITDSQMAGTLLKYSELGQTYINKLIAMMNVINKAG